LDVDVCVYKWVGCVKDDGSAIKETFTKHVAIPGTYNRGGGVV
jgi:hypothetical protein